VLTLFVIASCVTTACDSGFTATSASLTGPTTAGSVAGALTVEPAIIATELRTSSACRTDSPFDVRLDVNVRTRQDLFIRGIHFEFFDPSNRRVLPIPVSVTTDLTDSIQSPVPLPTTHPIPFPGEASMSSVRVTAGTLFIAPFRLQFDCGVPARGTLFVSVDAADAGGTVVVARTSVSIPG
jgi:hypothetical protein